VLTDMPLNLLDGVRVASPCPVRWEKMAATGDERVRHCTMCSLNVHDLAGMTPGEVEALLASHFVPGGANQGKRLCGTIRRRADGTIILRDCPVGLAKARAKARRAVARAAAMFGITALAAVAVARAQRAGWDPRAYRSFAMVADWIGSDAVIRTISPAYQTTSGDIAVDFSMIEGLQPCQDQPETESK
jgi:hypothetical protein